MTRDLSLYFHIPFCKKRCNYCDFYSTTALAQRDAYAAALSREIAAAPLEGYTAATIYFGGGTPSLMGERLCALLETLRRRMPFADDYEITLEANPSSVTPALLSAWRAAGCNRISFGLQDCDDAALHTLGRLHTAREGEAAVLAARAAGFSNISGDLMLATPGQTPEHAVRLADYAAALALPHISAYLLKIEPDTPFGRDSTADRCPDPDAAASLYLVVCDRLERAGYRHYEISNFALPGCESRHNTVYWTLGDYLGFGAAAYSFFGGRRFHHPPDLAGYCAAADPWRQQADDGPGGGSEEYLMLALRLRQGLSFAEADRRGIDCRSLRARALPLQKAGLLTLTAQGLSLTDQGFLLSNSIITELSVE